MKKLFALVLALALILSVAAVAETVKIGATPAPHAEILEFIKPMLAEQGIDLEVVIYNDYVVPNTAVEDGELDANYFQHLKYLASFNEEQGTHLVSAVAVHYEPFAVYSETLKSLDELEDGAIVGVPNDTSNEARALLMLESAGLIKLAEGAGVTASKLDIVENPKNLNIMEIEAAQLPLSLDSVGCAVINGNYAIAGGLNLADAIYVEDGTSSIIQEYYANALVVKEGNENNEAIQAVVTALTSDETRTFIEEKYGISVVALF